ncbi:hypothetical protein CLAIMM_03458 [Cladophialophora immunda]|nr:hypothetical protein CLAIMM_03458 [Cladophialophora immunda]
MANLKDLLLLRTLSWRLLLGLFVINVSVFSCGFDNSIYSTIQAMNSFEKTFGSYDKETHKYTYSANSLALLNSLGLPAKCVGAFVGYLIAENFGRRVSYVAMQTVVISGTAVSYTAKTYGQILAGRMLVQGMVGWDNFLAPMFIAEIVPPQVRGAMVVTYVFSHVFGSFICTLISNRTKTYPGNHSWQDPVLSCFAFPAFTLLFCWLIPESPRWLIRKNKKAKAVKWLRKLHGSTEGYDAETEADLLHAAITTESELRGTWLDLFRGTNARRTMIAVVSGAFNQLTGQSFVSQYGTLFVKSFNRMDPFVYSVMSNAIATLGPLIVFTMVDRVGRRPIYLVAGTLMTALLLTIGGLGTTRVNASRADGIIGCAAPYGLFYIMSFGAISAVTGAEVPHLRLRDKTSFLTYFVRFVSDFLITYTYPFLFAADHANLGAKVGFIYGGFGVLGIVWGYFYLPELIGRSLEEVNEMFEAGVPPRKFKSWESTNPRSIGTLATHVEKHPEQAKTLDIEHVEIYGTDKPGRGTTQGLD